MFAYKKNTHNTDSGLIVNNLEKDTRHEPPAFHLADNRAGTAKLMKMQNVLQLANKNSRRRKNVKNKSKQEKIALEGSERRMVEFGGNWEVLEVRDYLKRHQLKQQGTAFTSGKTVITLTDGSIILIDVSKYWRHESAEQENAYYDASHTISGDNARTHFWTRKGHSLYKQSQGA